MHPPLPTNPRADASAPTRTSMQRTRSPISMSSMVKSLPSHSFSISQNLTPQSQPDVVPHSSTAPPVDPDLVGRTQSTRELQRGMEGLMWEMGCSRRRRRREDGKDGNDDGNRERKREKGLIRVALTLGTKTRLPRGVGVEGDVGRRHGRALLHPHPEPKGRREEMFPSGYPRRYGSPESAFRVRFPPPFPSVISAYHLPLHSIKPRTQPQTP